uniref:Uncharacterized protein n=1 Tax=Ditylenchus dipsaci TaxID=166011 RepID=A0A915DYI0_9BILA
MIDHLGTLYDYASVDALRIHCIQQKWTATIVLFSVSAPSTNTNQASVIPSSSSSTSTSVVITSPQTVPTSPNVVLLEQL